MKRAPRSPAGRSSVRFEDRRVGWFVTAGWAALAVAVAVVLSVFGDAGRLLWFTVAVTLLVALPGALIVRLARLTGGVLDRAVMSLAAGMIGLAVAYAVASLVGQGWLAVAGGLVMSAVQVGLTFAAMRRNGPTVLRMRGPHGALAGVAAIALSPAAFMPLLWPNLSDRDGGLTFAPGLDGLLHLTIAPELQRGIPPQNPLAAGTPISYHWGSDLIPAAFGEFGVSVSEAVVRGLPTLYVLFAIAATFCLARRWIRSEWAAALVALLVLIGEDLAWIPGLITHRDGALWAADFFSVPSTFSLMSLNPMLLAVGFLSAFVLALTRWIDDGDRTWLWFAAAIGASLAQIKIFVFVQAICALALVALIRWVRAGDRRPLALLVALGLLGAPLVAMAARMPGAHTRLDFAPGTYLLQAVNATALGATWMGSAVSRVVGGDLSSVTSLIIVFGIVLPAYLVGVFGGRILGVPATVAALRRPVRTQPSRVFVALMVVIGLPATLLFSLTIVLEPGVPSYNNAVWFLLVSKDLLWLGAVEALWRVTANRSSAVRIVASCALVVISVPATVQLISVVHGVQSKRLPPDAVSVLTIARERCAAGAVTLASEGIASEVAGVAACRMVVTRGAENVAPLDAAVQRRDAVKAYWADWPSGRVGLAVMPPDVLVDLVIAGPEIPSEPGSSALRLVVRAGGYRLYEVAR